MPSIVRIVRKLNRSLTHGSVGTLGAYGTSRTSGAPGTFGINWPTCFQLSHNLLKWLRRRQSLTMGMDMGDYYGHGHHHYHDHNHYENHGHHHNDFQRERW
jgi:hypothetical protein